MTGIVLKNEKMHSVNPAFKKAGTALVSLLLKWHSTESHTAQHQQHLKRTPNTGEDLPPAWAGCGPSVFRTSPILFFLLPSFLFLHPSFSPPPPLTLTFQPKLPKCTKTTVSFSTEGCLVRGPVPNFSDCLCLLGN